MPREPRCPWCRSRDPEECEALDEVGTCPWDGESSTIHFEGDEDDEEAPDAG